MGHSPLFQLLSDPRVMESHVLEQDIQTIKRVLSETDPEPRGLFSFLRRLGQN